MVKLVHYIDETPLTMHLLWHLSLPFFQATDFTAQRMPLSDGKSCWRRSYSFNAVEGRLCTAFCRPGAKVRMDVMMVAYDTEKQPIVNPSQGTVVETKDAVKQLLNLLHRVGRKVLNGTVAIKIRTVNKAKTRNCSSVVTVAGSVSLPEMNILYAGWPHKLLATTAGTVSPSISAPGASVLVLGDYKRSEGLHHTSK